jgi:hypothetical protein
MPAPIDAYHMVRAAVGRGEVPRGDLLSSTATSRTGQPVKRLTAACRGKYRSLARDLAARREGLHRYE